MIVDLSAEELEILEGWYQSAAGESCGADTDLGFRLLEKLGFDASDRDLCLPSPDHVVDDYRHVVEAEREAILAYLERHPERKEDAFDVMEHS